MEYVLKQKGFSNEEQKARDAFRVGMELYGYCQGIFGRDSYGTKVITAAWAHSLVVSEKGVHNYSRKIESWVDLLESSNRALEEMENEEF